MKSIDLTSVQWQKSSYSSGNGQCVEAGLVPSAVAIRDSKNPEGPALFVTTEAWSAFVAAMILCEFPGT
jgi:hypothetical protein